MVDYLVKIKVGKEGKLKVIGEGYRQADGSIRITLSALPLDNNLWIFPFNK